MRDLPLGNLAARGSEHRVRVSGRWLGCLGRQRRPGGMAERIGDQGTARWPGRSPFPDDDSDDIDVDAFARLGAAVIAVHVDESEALRYLPERT